MNNCGKKRLLFPTNIIDWFYLDLGCFILLGLLSVIRWRLLEKFKHYF